MRVLYTALVMAVLVPLWLWRTWRAGEWAAQRPRWRERWGRAPLPAQARGALIVHAASMGEVAASQPFVERWMAARPGQPVLLTCTSATGSQRIAELYAGQLGRTVFHGYLPFDTPRAMRRWLQAVQPQGVVLMETELWPNLLAQAAHQGVPVMVANARLSARSLRGYARLRRWVTPMLTTLAAVGAQDRHSARRFRTLGVPAAVVSVTGNLKVEVGLPADLSARTAAWSAAVTDRPVWVAGSTHPVEDEAVLLAHRTVLARHPRALLIVVPRHPQRFDDVDRLLADSGLAHARRSTGQPPGPATQVWLADSMGEMATWFALAQVVYIGGSLIERGGHNPMEAMALARPVVSGPHVHNFARVFRELGHAGGAVQVQDAAALGATVTRWFDHPSQARDVGQRGLQMLSVQGGAAQRTCALVAACIDMPDPQGQPQRVVRSQFGRDVTWHDPTCLHELPPRAFEPAWWEAQGQITGRSRGRGTAWFVRHDGQHMVLRHYRRGGLFGKLVKHTFLGTAPADSRALREYALLRRMVAWGLPVPRACAARMRRRSPWHYSADILVARIPGAQDVAGLMQQAPVAPTAWHALGAAIRRMHDWGVHHSDLNCRNLLVDEQAKAWIIDFDKCGLRRGDGWKKDDLARLLRSLRKEQRLHPGLHWRPADWDALLAGYAAASDPAASAPVSV